MEPPGIPLPPIYLTSSVLRTTPGTRCLSFIPVFVYKSHLLTFLTDSLLISWIRYGMTNFPQLMSVLCMSQQTTAAIVAFIHALYHFPMIAQKVYQEIVRVTVGDRLPRIVDRSQLPYTEAVWKESLRWHPPIPLGTREHGISICKFLITHRDSARK